MKFIILLSALVAVALAAPPQPAIPFDSTATGTAGVIGKIQTANNVYGDIVTLGVNAGLGVNAKIDQDIVNVIISLLNNQNENKVDPAKLQGIQSFLEKLKPKN
jgi:hypothetical protein